MDFYWLERYHRVGPVTYSIRPQMKMRAAVFPDTQIADRLSDW